MDDHLIIGGRAFVRIVALRRGESPALGNAGVVADELRPAQALTPSAVFGHAEDGADRHRSPRRILANQPSQETLGMPNRRVETMSHDYAWLRLMYRKP